MDYINQIELEGLFHKNQTMNRLRREFAIPEIIEYLQEVKIPQDFAINLLAQMVLHKRAKMSVLVGLLHHHFGNRREDLQTCADMVIRAAEADLIDWDDFAAEMVLRIDVSQDVYDDLDRYQYPLPMVVEPNLVVSNRDTGYLTSKGSIILRQNHHEDDVCLDHINRVNKTKLTINVDTVRMVKNQWKNLVRPKDGETKAEFDRRVKCFEKYDRTAKDVMEHLFIAGNEFHLTHKYDKRGRCYAQGYHVNPQGNDWNKAVIEFANKEIVT